MTRGGRLTLAAALFCALLAAPALALEAPDQRNPRHHTDGPLDPGLYDFKPAIFPPGLRVFLTFVVPVAFAVTVLAQALLNAGQSIFDILAAAVAHGYDFVRNMVAAIRNVAASLPSIDPGATGRSARSRSNRYAAAA